MALLDDEGKPAVVGKSLGVWLDEADFVFAGEDHEHDEVAEMGRHSFPRDWPDVYEESEVLRSMLKKKGPCAAKRVSVVPNVGEDQKGLVAGLELRWLQSYANAEAVKKKTGLQTVEGWAIYDLLDDVTGAAFAAERYWWNTSGDGTWVDFSPRAENVRQLLLVEALAPRAARRPCVLTRRQLALAERLLELRCPKAKAAAAKAAVEAGRTRTVPGPAQPAAPTSAEELRAMVKRVKLGIADPIYQLQGRVDADPALCEELVGSGMCGALVGLLASRKHAAAAARLLAALTGAALERGICRRASDSVLATDGVEPLVEALSSPEDGPAADAAAALACLCFRCPTVQERAAKKGAIRLVIKMLSKGQQQVSSPAAFALWHLQVGCARNAASALTEGAAPALLPLLREEAIDEKFRLRVIGALMPLATTPGAQDELGGSGAVSALCSLLSNSQPPQIQQQAAGALMNLLSGHDGNCALAAQEDIVEPLVRLVREGERAGREYAAGALANVIARGGSEIGPLAVAAGAFEALGGLLAGPGNMAEVFATLANLARYLPEGRGDLLEPGVVERLVVAIADEEDPARHHALALCMNLAPHPPSKARLLRGGAVRPLLGLLESSEEELRERAAGALANLMDGRADAAANVFMAAPDLARRLVDALETEYCGRVQRQMARALALLASRRPEPVRKAGGLEPLAAAMEELAGKEAAWEPALGLMNLGPSSKEREELAGRGALFGALVRLLAEPGAPRTCAAGALANLTAGCEAAARAAISAGALQPLLDLLLEVGACGAAPTAGGPRSQARTALEWAAGALGNLAEYGGTPARTQIVDRGALEPLVRLLIDSQGTVQELALFALGTLRSVAEPELQERLKEAIDPLRDLTIRLYEGRLRDTALCLLRLAK